MGNTGIIKMNKYSPCLPETSCVEEERDAYVLLLHLIERGKKSGGSWGKYIILIGSWGHCRKLYRGDDNE